MGGCKTVTCIILITIAILIGLTQGFYWAFLGLAPNSSPGLIALYCISAIVMLIICIIGILGACNVCYPVFIIMWIIGMAILIAVIVIQIILNATLACTAASGSVNSIVCNQYAALTWAGLGVTLGLAVLGLIFGIIMFRVYKEEDEGGSSSSNPTVKAKNDFAY